MTDDQAQPGPQAAPRGARPVLGSFIGMSGMAAVLFVILAGSVAPWWALALMTLVWLGLFVLGARWFMPHPWWVAALPVVTICLWLACVALGAGFLGWSA